MSILIIVIVVLVRVALRHGLTRIEELVRSYMEQTLWVAFNSEWTQSKLEQQKSKTNPS